MRAMVVRPGPHFSVQDVSRGWVRGLSQFLDHVGDFNFDDRLDFYDQALSQAMAGDHEFPDVMRLACKSLSAQVYEYWPDIVFVVSGFFTPPELLMLYQQRGHKVVLLATESPYEEDHQLTLAPFCDLVVLNDPTNLHLYQAITKAIYLPHAYDPEIHYRRSVDPDLLSEFAFVGTGYPSRVGFFEAVDWSGIDVALGGNWQSLTDDSPLGEFVCHERDFCLENEDAVRLYSSTLTSANLYRRETQKNGTHATADGWSMGPREVELAAVGTFYLTEARPENREVLPMIPTFVGPDDFGEQLRWWLAHEKEREQVAAEAQRAVSDRTFRNHARRLLELLDI